MIVRVNMKTKQVTREPLPDKYFMLGGRGLTSRLLLDEVDPLCHPLGPGNKLVVATGLLGGTAAPCSGRLSVGAKSPLTGGIKESNGGGTAATRLSRLGIRALIIEGEPTEEGPFVLQVSAAGLEILPAEELKGLGNYDTAATLLNRYGGNKSVISIGPAGERCYPTATVAITDMEGRPARHCGRGGMGAVMGAKKIKAIVVDGDNAPQMTYSNEKEFKRIAREWAAELIETKKVLTGYGTANLVSLLNSLGGLPTRNFREGNFEGAEKICGERLRQLLEERGGAHGHPCHPGCVIRCSNIFVDQQGNYVTSALEYETIGLLGSNCGVDDLDFIARMDRFCDDFGIDTMELGVSLGISMEAGLLHFGDQGKILALVDEIIDDTPVGRLLSSGAATAGRVLGVRRVPVVKGQSMSAYDPRVMKATGVTYATSPMGADHTTGNCLPGRKGYRPASENSTWDLSIDMQVMTAVCDYCGLCFFAGPTKENMEVIAGLLNAKYGTNLTFDDVINKAKQLIKDEIEFNKRAGLPPTANALPEFFMREKLEPTGSLFDIPRDRLTNLFEEDF